MTLITDEAVEAAATAKRHAHPFTEVRNELAAFIAFHEGEQPCPDCAYGQQEEPDGVLYRCPTCNGTGKTRTDRLVKLSEAFLEVRKISADESSRIYEKAIRADQTRRIVEALRECESGDPNDPASWASDYIEREFGVLDDR